MVTANVVGLGVLDEGPDGGRLQVLEVVVVGGTEIRDHGAVAGGHNNGAAAGGLLLVDTVLDTQTGLGGGLVQDVGVLVLADTAEEDDAVSGQDVLGTTGGVLGSTAGGQGGIAVVEEVLVDTEVLGLGKDGVVGLDLVGVEGSLVAVGNDVCEMLVGGTAVRGGWRGRRRTEERVLQTQEAEVLLGSHCGQLGTVDGDYVEERASVG